MNFSNQCVLVIGGSSGIGFAAARAFVLAGAKVTIASRSHDNVTKAADSLGCAAMVLDVRNDADVEELASCNVEWDHVVVSAASTPTGRVRELPLTDAFEAMNSKFWGAYRIVRVVRMRPGGSITFVSGFLGTRPNPSSVLQGAINAALESLGRGLALELGPIRVNTVSPGIIDTPLWGRAPENVRNTVFRRTMDALPVRRVGHAEDVAKAILYLADNDFATGSTVSVDGGGTIA